MVVSEVTVLFAFATLFRSAVAPVKLVPLMVTLVPTGPLVGEKLAIVGALTTVNELELVAVPPGAVTLSVPEVAPAGTVARMVVSEVTVKVALVPLNATVVAPVKLVPLMVTLVPTGPLVGEKLVIVGGLTTVNEPALVAGPPAGLTPSHPDIAHAGTVARKVVSEVTVKVALVPLNATAVAPVKLDALMVAVVATGPLVGEKLAIVGPLTTVNEPALVAVPPGVVTLSDPLVAPAGTVAWMVVAEVTVKLALVPLNATTDRKRDVEAVIVTLVATGPLVGEKLVIVGPLTTVNEPALVAVPPGVVTLMVPDEAPAGTVAWMAVAEVTVKFALVPLKATAAAAVTFVPPLV